MVHFRRLKQNLLFLQCPGTGPLQKQDPLPPRKEDSFPHTGVVSIHCPETTGLEVSVSCCLSARGPPRDSTTVVLGLWAMTPLRVYPPFTGVAYQILCTLDIYIRYLYYNS
ncbi:mCG147314 [Mus musculus]|nr:mCG147314 [Mus musculus]